MTPAAFPSVSTALAHQVEAFEVALASDSDADIGQFLPPYGHPLHLVVLAELIRVDLEYAWSRDRPKRLAAYCSRFPAILEHDTVLGEVAFEEYRQRSQAGEAPSPAEYRVKYGISTTDWPDIAPGSEQAPVRPTSESALFPPTHRLPLPSPVVNGDLPATNRLPLPSPVVNGDLPATNRLPAPPPHKGPETDGTAVVADLGRQLVSEWEESTDSLPEPGRLFLGFRLVEVLGQGAFGRVYLAHQGDLAGRPVALKVARDIVGESRTLAQLQHTNIVPIYSFHKIGPFQAVCMPFLGRATLADCVKQIHDSGLPSTGKQLRSTLDQRKSVTTPGSGTGSSAQPVSTPGQEPAPARAIPTDQPATEVSPASAPGGWAQFDGFSYVEAVLWIGAQLADGLAHAHARGITHRDLKPANILLTDDGRPMLLDFNLAEDTKLRGSAERAGVGGTLPYMAPEHMEEFRARTGKLDQRCDIYSLGVIFFELLTGQRPHPDRKGVLRETVPLMIADRRQPPPSLRQLNPDISPGVEAIVQKCLAADAADRYQQAEHLREDINRHLSNRPLKYAPNPSLRERLRKWARRHPRLTSSGSVAVAAAALLIGLGSVAVYSRERTRELEAHARLAEHQTAFRDAQVFLDDKTRSLPRLDVGLDAFRGVLARYGVPENPDAGEDWLSAGTLRYLPENARARLREDIGESFYLMARAAYLKGYASTEPSTRASEAEHAAGWNALAAKYAGDRLPRAIKDQNAAITALRGDRAEADRLRGEAATIPLVSARDLTLAGDQLYRLGHHERALGHLVPATRLDPENFSAWFLRGCAELALKQHALAAASFGACISLRPDSAPAWLNRGLAFRGMAFAGLRFTKLARGDFDRAIELDPTLTDAFIERALLRIEERDLAGAEADYDRALATGTAPVRVYFLRSSIRNQRGDAAGAKADREAGLKLTPADEMSWIARAENRLDADPTAALADDEEALKLNPTSIFGLQLKAHILAEHLNRPAEAMAALDRAVELNPDFVPARAGRGVMLARAGERDAAIRDAKDALRRDAGAPILYQVGGIYALTAKTHPADKPEAIRLLWGALKRGYGLDMVDTDTDLDPIRNDPDFQQMVKDARALNARRD